MGTHTGPSFQAAEKRCFHVLHVWEEKLWNQSPSLKKFIRLDLCQNCVKIFKSSSSKAKKVQSGCLLGIGDQRIFCVLHTNLGLMFSNLQYDYFLYRQGASFKIFSCNVTPFSC